VHIFCHIFFINRYTKYLIELSILPYLIMPPASMVDNSLMSLDPFGQMSLGDPFASNSNQSPPSTTEDTSTNNNPSSVATPPQLTKMDNMASPSHAMVMPSMKSTTTPGYQQPNQQPMQITPDNNNPVVGYPQSFKDTIAKPITVGDVDLFMSSMKQQQQYDNYQLQQQQQQYPPQMQPGGQMVQPNGQMQQSPNMQQPVANALASPPISPLWNPTSPGQTPPNATNMQVTAPLPTLPTGFGGAPVPQLSPNSPAQAAVDPFATFEQQHQVSPQAQAQDPFATGNAIPDVSSANPVQGSNGQQDDADFWNDMGFGNKPTTEPAVTPADSNAGDNSVSSVTSEDDTNSSNLYDHSLDDTPVTLDERGLPEGGEYYNARVTTTMLGAIFSSAKELRSTLFKTASNSFVEAIGDKPVISFTINGSAADTAGIELGHVLLKVNGESVGHTDDAVKMVGAASRPMTMEFYIPNKNVRVVKSEGQCMVKYDNHSTDAPVSACEWKPKYVVVGDMLGKPHIIYMYRTKVRTLIGLYLSILSLEFSI